MGITGCNIVLARRLQETFFDKKAFTVYIKEFMKKTLKHLEANNPDRAAIFKANAQGAVKKILGSFKEWQFFTGESMDPEGSLAFMNYPRTVSPHTFKSLSTDSTKKKSKFLISLTLSPSYTDNHRQVRLLFGKEDSSQISSMPN